MHPYLVVTLGHMRDLGWGVDGILNKALDFSLHFYADSAVPGPLWSRQYWFGLYALNGSYVQSWTDAVAGKTQTMILAQPMTSGATSFTVLGYHDTQGNPQENLMDISISNGDWMQIGSEKLRAFGYVSSGQSKQVTGFNATTDRVTITGHGYADGETIMFGPTIGQGSQSYTLDAGMVGGNNCSFDHSDQRTKNCWFWLKVIDANTIELYRDAALTNLVNLTGGNSGTIYSIRSTVLIWSICGTGTQACRGQFDTAAAAHNPGDVATRLLISAPAGRDPAGDADGSHAVYHSSGMAVAVDMDATATDSLTGGPITARRAYEQFWGSMRWKDRFGGGGACSPAGISTCDNPVWGIRPRHRIKDVTLATLGSGPVLQYTAPTGHACRVGISSTPFASTDDSGDTSDNQVIAARSFALHSAGAGKTYYRITCGPEGGTTRVSGTFTPGQ
jgi:hypothetical protein